MGLTDDVTKMLQEAQDMATSMAREIEAGRVGDEMITPERQAFINYTLSKLLPYMSNGEADKIDEALNHITRTLAPRLLSGAMSAISGGIQ